MKPQRSTSAKALNKPHGWIYGARWAGRTVEARVVYVTIGVSTYKWCNDLVGQKRQAIEIKVDDQVVYCDNEDGVMLATVLKGLAPLPKTRFVPVFQVLDDREGIRVFYKAQPGDGCA